MHDNDSRRHLEERCDVIEVDYEVVVEPIESEDHRGSVEAAGNGHK